MQKERGWLVVLLLLALIFIHASCSKKKEYRVLVVHSYEESCASYPDFNKMISHEFKKRGMKTDIRTLYLNCESYLDGPEQARMSEMLDSLIHWRPDVILVNEDQATYSLLKCGNPLVKEVPIVFAGVNYPNWGLIKQFPNVTGLHDKIDFKTNIKMIQYFYGKDIHFSTILDSTYLDRQIIADAREQLKDTEVIAFGRSIMGAECELLRREGKVYLNSIHVRAMDRKELVQIGRAHV